MRSTVARCGDWQKVLRSWLWSGYREPSWMRSLSGVGSREDDLLEWTKDLTGDPVLHVDQEMEDFLLTKAQQEGSESNRLLSTPIAPLPSAVEEALSVCEDQLEKVDDIPKKPVEEAPIQFSSKFGTHRADFVKELQADLELNDLPGAVSDEKIQHGMIQDFLDSFSKAKESSKVDSSFGPLKRSPYKALSLTNRDDDLDDHRPLPSGAPIPRGGFRINIYRNLTGSVKELLIDIRKRALTEVTDQVRSEASPNAAFIDRLLESLKYADVTVKGDLRPRMNALCLSLMECLDRLTPNEAALVCLVFGQLGYSNSLVYYQLISKLQKLETMKAMSIEALSGSVLSLGMLQSTDPEFMNIVLREFINRVQTSEAALPSGTFGCLIVGCSHSKESDRAQSMTATLIDCMMSEELHREDRSVAWLDLAVGAYVCSEMKLLKPDLIKGIQSKLINTRGNWNMTCEETAVLLVGLEGLSPLVHNRPLHPVWREAYILLEDHVGHLIEKNEIHLTSVPDLVRNLSFPGMERMEHYKALGRLIVDADLDTALPLWPLVHRLMAGYANVLYRDPEVLKALNARFRAAKMPQLQTSTIANLLHVGCRLRGLEESVVNRIVELVTPKAFFWQKVVRFKDAAKIAYSLAAFEKLTPEIFGECWKRCQSIRFDQYDDMLPDEAIDTAFIGQGLFAGYQYVRQKFSASAARKYISLKGHKDLTGFIKKKNQTQSGLESKAQREVSKYLSRMGVNLACPALILEGLFRVDMVFQDAKVVVYVSGDRSFYCNHPYSLTGAMLAVKRAVESYKIKVVIIKESDWKKTPENEREAFLLQSFSNQGIDLKKLMKSPTKKAAADEPTNEDLQTRVMDWLSVRSTVLNGMKREKLVTLLRSRSDLLESTTDEAVGRLTHAALSQNGIAAPTTPRRTISSKTKPEIINDILCLEVQNLFGDTLHRLIPSSSGDDEMMMEDSELATASG